MRYFVKFFVVGMRFNRKKKLLGDVCKYIYVLEIFV